MSTTTESHSKTAPGTSPCTHDRTRAGGSVRRLLILLATLSLVAMASAQSVVVHPFGGQDLVLGAAVAERAAVVLEESGLSVYGPEIAPTLIPPLVVTNGFLNPAVFLGDGGIDGPTGAKLLRQTLGADAAVTGTISLQDERFVLDMFLSSAMGAGDTVRIESPQDAPELLATRVAREIARSLGTPPPRAVEPFEVSGSFGDYARAISLVGAGFANDARNLLATADSLPPEGEELLADLEAAAEATGAGDPVRSAVFGLSFEEFREADVIEAFSRFAGERDLPAASLWLAVLAASSGDEDLARASFEAAAQRYPYGAMSLASYLLSRQSEDVDMAAEVGSERLEDDVAALLAASIIAENAEDTAALKAALQHLSRAAPFFTYPFERLSFIAFDENEPLAAAEALVVAVELDPDSDLYWTNLGWAYYLLGFLERSEIASERAIELDSSQFIARYNLGLAHAVRDDLDAALPEYERALQFDPGVDDEAVADLENAISLYPDAPAVHYALAFLYAAEGRRSEAADQYEAYLQKAEALGTLEPRFADRAQRQVSVLRAPPAPLEITRGAELVLGASGEQSAPFHPGDPLAPVFELFTPGSSLPQQVGIELSVLDPDGVAIATSSGEVTIPSGAIGFVVDNLRIELPDDVPAGDYRFEVRATASEGRLGVTEIDFTVEGEPLALRRLLGWGIEMQSLGGGGLLYGPRDLVRADRLPEILVSELRTNADAADGAIPVIDEGRFEGLGGGDLFRLSTEQDVQAFLDYLFAQGTTDATFVFAEVYAQWALDGAPVSGSDRP